MEIGTALKKLRVGKNISRQELVKGIMSTNHYFKIENNENNISLDKFIAIISRLNVTFNEFAYVTNDYKNNEKKAISASITELYYSQENKVTTLKTLQKKCDSLFQQSNDVFYQHHSILISAIINDFQLDARNIDILTKYFLQIKDCSLYEIKIFANFAYLFETDVLVTLSKKILKGFLKFEEFEETNKDYIFFLLNLVNVFHVRVEPKIAVQYIQLATQHISSKDFFPLTILKYHQGINLILNKDLSGKPIVEDALLIFEKLNSHFHTLYKNEYESYLNLYDQP